MSIALSVEIRPSRLLSLLHFGFAAFFSLTGILVCLEQVGHYQTIVRQLLTFLMLLVSFFLVFIGFRSRKTLRIDISGNGQIRLQEYKRSVSKPSSGDIPSAFYSEIGELSENSTIWPSFMILQLKTESGKRIKVLICQDCLKREQFKSLYTSIRWIEAHRKLENKNL